MLVGAAFVAALVPAQAQRPPGRATERTIGTNGPADSPAVRGFVITIPRSSPQLRQIRTQPVDTASVSDDEVVAPGRVALDPRRISRVALPVPGRVDRVMTQIGDAVRGGQPLLTLDSAEAEGAMADFRQAQAAMSQATAALSRAQADLDRVRDLLEHKAVARKDVMHADEELAQAQGALAQAEAVCGQARRRLEILGLEPGKAGQRVVVRASIAGKVLDVSVTAGEYRNDTSDPVMTIADLTTVLVTSEVAERDIRLVQVGERVAVELVAYPGEVFEARVTRIADTVDVKTRTVQVQAEMANRDGRLRPEMFGRIRHSHSARRVPVVPPQAILQSARGPVVFVERSTGVFERTAVLTGQVTAGRVPILRGLRAGDRVVVDGALLLNGSWKGDNR
jgi:cobalt-zinc-cadmium efflux system membrane fusion protein